MTSTNSNSTLALVPAIDQDRSWQSYAESKADYLKAVDFTVACQDLMARHAADGERRDANGINLSACKVEADESRTPYLLTPSHGAVALRDHAFSQLSTGIKAPAKYLRELPQSIALDAMNWGLREHGNDGVTIRGASLSGRTEARAIVSDRFAALDDRPALGEVYRFLRDTGRLDSYGVTSIATGRTTVVRCVSREAFTGPDGQALHHGFDFRNSEVGTASLSIRAVIFRVICTNGMISAAANGDARWRHIGDTARLRDGFREAFPLLLEEGQLMAAQVANLHTATFSIVDIQKRLARLDITRTQQADAFREALIEADVIDVSTSSADIKALPAQTEITGWHAVNGLTAAAKGYGTEQRIATEQQAGRFAARFAN